MARTSRRRTPAPSRWRHPARPRRILLVGAAAIALVAVGVATILIVASRGSAGPVAWARLGSEDVHSLAFVGQGQQHLLFGHHGGLDESRDGGRTWAPLPVRDDAMSLSPASDASIVIAGHDVLVASRDGGATWSPMRGDLPDLDIHGLTRDPANPARLWATLASGGLWESTDLGAHWTRVRDDRVFFPTAVRVGTLTRLLGVDGGGLAASDDGGRTWTALGSPPTYPMTAFAASADGSVLYAGSTDGLVRSGDGGRTWTRTGYPGSAFAIATSTDGQIVAVVSRTTEFFRSSDGGATWPGRS